MADPTDVLVCWTAGAPTAANWKAPFHRPLRLVQVPTPSGQQYRNQLAGMGWPHPLRTILANAGVDKPLRVAVVGFSETCQGVMGLLRSDDAALIEHAILIDGIHCNWEAGSANASRTNINSACMAPTVAYADLASRGAVAVGGLPPARRYCTITHSSIVPPFPSTTETARFILDKLFASGWPKAFVPADISDMVHDPPWHCSRNNIDYAQTTFDHAHGQNGLAILGYKNLDPAGTCDHIYQAQVVFPAVLRFMLAPRWNEQDPGVPRCGIVPAAGPSLQAGQSCAPEGPLVIPDGQVDGHLDFEKWIGPVEEPGSFWGQFLGWTLGVLALGGLGWGGWKLWGHYYGRGRNPVRPERILIAMDRVANAIKEGYILEAHSRKIGKDVSVRGFRGEDPDRGEYAVVAWSGNAPAWRTMFTRADAAAATFIDYVGENRANSAAVKALKMGSPPGYAVRA